MTAAVGTRLAGRYVLEERIAGGGMGEVWRARDEVLERTVAVKLLRREHADDADFIGRFREEARHAASLTHPGIASVYDYGEQPGDDEPGGTPYLVMEYVDGETLSSLLSRAGGPLGASQALDIVGQAAFALQAAHDAGIVHRDVKPGNLMVRRDGLVKVTDFGIARAQGAGGRTRTGDVIGTAHYLSPEQAEGRSATPASDIYALGVVTYEALAGRRPFAGEAPVSVALAHVRTEPPPLPDDVPGPVRDLVAHAMRKDPAARPASAGEFGRTAMALASDPSGTATTVVRRAAPATTQTTPAPAPAPAPPEPRHAPGQRRVRNRMIAAGAVVVLIGGLLLWLLTPARAELPDVTNIPVAKARSALTAAGMHVTTKTQHDAGHPAGVVIWQQPAPHTTVDKGSTVTLVLASGPLLVTVDKTAYVGKPADQVKAALTRLGLQVAEQPQPSAAPAGSVLDVAPAGQVRERTLVTLTVATAPPPAPARNGAGHDNGHGSGPKKGHD